MKRPLPSGVIGTIDVRLAPQSRNTQNAWSEVLNHCRALFYSGGPAECFSSSLQRRVLFHRRSRGAQSTMERILAATRTSLFFTVRKFPFRDNLRWVSTRLLYYVRGNFAVLESVEAVTAN
jgi:hypothetical protein